MKAVNAYLTFGSNCREAVEYYGKCFGVKPQMTTFGQVPGNSFPGAENLIMHANLQKDGVTILMASDTPPGMSVQAGNNFSVAVACSSNEEVDSLFAGLSANGKVTMPPGETFWAYKFAMCTDQFGVNWMLNHERPMPSGQ